MLQFANTIKLANIIRVGFSHVLVAARAILAIEEDLASRFALGKRQAKQVMVFSSEGQTRKCTGSPPERAVRWNVSVPVLSEKSASTGEHLFQATVLSARGLKKSNSASLLGQKETPASPSIVLACRWNWQWVRADELLSCTGLRSRWTSGCRFGVSWELLAGHSLFLKVWVECRTGEEDMRSAAASKEVKGGRRSPLEATLQKWWGSTSSVQDMDVQVSKAGNFNSWNILLAILCEFWKSNSSHSKPYFVDRVTAAKKNLKEFNCQFERIIR